MSGNLLIFFSFQALFQVNYAGRLLISHFTSLAGLAPMVLFPGSGSELYRGVGAVVLGGLTLSTALTLFVVRRSSR